MTLLAHKTSDRVNVPIPGQGEARVTARAARPHPNRNHHGAGAPLAHRLDQPLNPQHVHHAFQIIDHDRQTHCCPLVWSPTHQNLSLVHGPFDHPKRLLHDLFPLFHELWVVAYPLGHYIQEPFT